MKPVVRTIYAGHIQSSMLLGLDYEPLHYTTLNEKFDIQPGFNIADPSAYPRLRYAAIGNQGVSFEQDTGGIPLMLPERHRPSDGALFNHIPFIVRPIGDDLPTTAPNGSPSDFPVRGNYRMRKVMTIDGEDYAVYYLKALDLSQTSIVIELRNVDGSIISSTPFAPTDSDANDVLNPEPPQIDTNVLNEASGDYLVASAKVPFILTTNDVAEIINAVDTVFGDPRYAVISEIALCTGHDATVSSGNISYTEAVRAQIAAFFHQFHALTSTTQGVDMEFDVGAVEHLLATTES